MKDSNNQKIIAITTDTLIVGVDIAKITQWARFVDFRGLELDKAIKFQNTKQGFEIILASIQRICKSMNYAKIIVGMEPTGHYWKTLANYLKEKNIKVVMVNPFHTKKAKELDDNSQTKSDKKDALTIAKLVSAGRYYEVYMPKDIYADLRVLSNTRISLMKQCNSTKNKIIAILDEYFPELVSVFKNPFDGKSSMQILRICPFPEEILKLGTEGVLLVLREAVKKTVGIQKAELLVDAAKHSIGVKYGMNSTKLRMKLLIENLDLLMNHRFNIEMEMEKALQITGIGNLILGIPGLGIVTASTLLGEIGDPMRFNDPRQIIKFAGYNLVENSSGQNVSKTVISKRGRKNLRSILYMMARIMVATNPELKRLYNYLKTRKKNPLKGKQALIVIAKKTITIIFYMVKKQNCYNAKLVFNEYRKKQFKEVA